MSFYDSPILSYQAIIVKIFKTNLHKTYDYEKSNLIFLKSLYLEGKYPELKHLVEKNSMMVKITAIKNGKVKNEFNELKFSDNLVEIFKNYSMLNYYQDNLIKYKSLRDEGKKSLLMLEYGEDYTSIEEFNNVKTLIQATSNARKLLEKQENNALTDRIFNFLKSNITVKREYFEYDIVTNTIYNIPEFNKYELEELEMLNGDMAGILEKMSAQSNKDTKKSNSNGQEM